MGKGEETSPASPSARESLFAGYTQPLECTHRVLSFEGVGCVCGRDSSDSSGFKNFLGLMKFAFDSERVK